MTVFFKTSSLDNNALPAGFSVCGLRCGISVKPGKKDLALFYSDRAAAAAGVFTRNLFKAAPVLLSQTHLKTSTRSRAVIINSGCANACTGRRGDEDAAWTARALAGGLKIPARQVLVGSTGVIGRRLPRPALARGVRRLADAVRRAGASSVRDAVSAIMTTDTRPKVAHLKFLWDGKPVTVWGCAKGAGMIHPNMATMLSVILTDAALPPAELRAALRWVTDRTFNRVSVDGDTSTNDSVFLLANGAAEKSSRRSSKVGFQSRFRAALHEVCLALSYQIAADGEGATRTAWIFVEGAATETAAARLASVVATSPLVKTALHGADPNWGRVLAALGRAGVAFDPAKVEVRFGGVAVVRNGEPTAYSDRKLHEVLKKKRVTVHIHLHQGKAWSHYVTCDYSREYVAINADYTT